MASAWTGSVRSKDSAYGACSRQCCSNIFFAATITVVALQHLRAGTDILADLVHLEGGVQQEEGGGYRGYVREDGDEGSVGHTIRWCCVAVIIGF